jgi:hypothetical protein
MSSLTGGGRFEKRLKIGVRFDGTGFVLLDGQALPAITKNAIGELVLAPESLSDPAIRAAFTDQRNVPLLSSGSAILMGVSPTMVEHASNKALIPANAVPILSSYLFVEVTLEADLWLQVRGDQEAKLMPCACSIPSLNEKAESLNHAFTIISVAYETKRRSHSGNVFERAYARDRNEWKSLDELRIRVIETNPGGGEQLDLSVREHGTE